ncbi:MAG: OmpA family protein [Bacteroidia bacterium]|nr:OmpA family protein [Bacteroidia bacterium]
MKKFIPFLVYIIFISYVSAQNLVPNPSFEDYIQLPCQRTDIGKQEDFGLKYWTWPTAASPDVFSTLVDKKYWTYACPFGTKESSAGHQLPHTGHVMAGFYTYGKFMNIEYHEYLQVELLQPLIAGETYYAGFWLTRSCLVDMASNNIGIYFTEKPFSRRNIATLNLSPQINEAKIITNSIVWTKVSGEFKAEKPAKYLIIGNFYKDSETLSENVDVCNDKWLLDKGEAYYYIDDVFVQRIEKPPSDSAVITKRMNILFDSLITVDNINSNYEEIPVILNNIFFDFDKAELLKESYTDLDKLYNFLSIVDYLVLKGIERNRLYYKGYGYTRPVGSTGFEGNPKNRRVELIIQRR